MTCKLNVPVPLSSGRLYKVLTHYDIFAARLNAQKLSIRAQALNIHPDNHALAAFSIWIINMTPAVKGG